MKALFLGVLILFPTFALAAEGPAPGDAGSDTEIMGCQYCRYGNVSCRECAQSVEEANFFIIENSSKDAGIVGEGVRTSPLLSDCTYPAETGCPDGQKCVRVSSWLMRCMR